MGNALLRFAAPEDLIIHKIVAGRPRDLEDVKTVLIKNPEVDINYIRHWLRKLASALKEPFLRRFNKVLKEIQ
jgi:hypothetical protein